MRKIMLAVSCITIIILTACQNNENTNFLMPQTSIESTLTTTSESSSKKEDTTLINETQTQSPQTEITTTKKTVETNSTLSVPIQITIPSDSSDIYKTSQEPHILGTEEHLKIYDNWITNLDSADITAFYAYTAPFSEYTQGKMSLADSQTLFNKLKSIKPTLFAADEDRMNPPTGGWMDISIQTKDERAVIGFNGAWLIVYLNSQGKQWIFDAQEKNVQSICYEIKEMLYENMNNGTEKDSLLYKNETVESLYAVNGESFVMAKVDNNTLSKDILQDLESYKSSGTNPDGLAYLIFTEKGKEYIYLDDVNTALIKNCRAALANFPLHPSWLIHMAPDKIVNANGVTDKQTLLDLSKFLKEDVTVQSDTTYFKGPVNPSTVAGTYSLTIDFVSGTRYNLIGYDYFDGSGNFSLYTSDLDGSVGYKCDKYVSAKLRELLSKIN